MKKVISVWSAIAGVLWSVLALIFILAIFGTINELANEDGAIAVVFVLLIMGSLIAGYIMNAIGLFTANDKMTKNGTLTTAISFTVVVVLMLVGFKDVLDLGARIIGTGYVIFMILTLAFQCVGYFLLFNVAKRKFDNQNVDKQWYMPTIFFGVSFLCVLILLSIKSSYADRYMIGFFDNWLVVLISAGLSALTGLAIKNPVSTAMVNQNGFVQPGGYMNQNMYGQPGGYMNQNMYGQQNGYMNQNMNQQQPNTYMNPNMMNQQGYMDPNANPYAQQQNGYMDPNMNQQQPNAYMNPNMNQQQPNAYMNPNMMNQQQGGYMNPNANSYTQQQQQGFVDPNAQYNNPNNMQ